MLRSVVLALCAVGPLAAATSTIRADGVMLVEGRPHFPLGVYYNARYRADSQVAGDMQMIKAAGYNAIEASQIIAWSAPDAALAAAHANGLRAYLEVPFQSASTPAWVAARRTAPAVVAWNVADDSHRRFTIEQMASMAATARQAAPGQVLYQTVYDGSVMGPYLQYTDMTWGYRYPVYASSEGSDLAAVDVLVMKPLEDSGRPFMAVPQAYRWTDNSANRVPTPREYRGMAWQTLIAGAKGLILYSLTDGGWLPTTEPALWGAMRTLNNEVQPLCWILGDGQRTRLATGSLVAGHWTRYGSMLIAVTNASQWNQAVNLAISGAPSGTLQPVGPVPTTSLTWSGGRLTGTLGPAETHLYRIGALTNAAPVLATQAITVAAGGSATIALGSDPEGDGVVFTITTPPTRGTLSGSGANRIYTPNAGYTGSDSFTVAAHDGWVDAIPVTRSITVGGGAINTAPTISNLPDQSTTVGSALPDVAFVVGDAQTAAGSLTVTASSSNPTLVPIGNLVLGGSGSNRTLTITPAANQTGTATITVMVSDGTLSASDTLVVTVSSGTTAGGWQAVYYDNPDFSGTRVARTDQTIAFDWGQGAPTAGFGVDGFSVRWSGLLKPPHNEVYTFTASSDDGVRVWVNGRKVIDQWVDQGTTAVAGQIALTANQDVLVVMEYYETGGGATAKLEWQSASQARQVIPATSVRPASGDDLPGGWSARDVGVVSPAGASSEAAGTWTVQGSGAAIWNTADGFQFCHQEITGDVRITARVSGITGSNPWAKAGVMLRESTAAGSRHAMVCATSASGIAFQRRTSTNGASSHTAGPNSPTPYWVRLERSGDLLIASCSANGTTWTEIRRETVVLGAKIQVGLAVTSHGSGALASGIFTNVTIIGAPSAGG